MKNFWIFAASLALLGCASAPSEKTRAQMRAEKADSDALMILADGLPSAPVPRDSIPIGGGVLYRVEKSGTAHIFSRLRSDGGKTWSEPSPLKYADTGRYILNPNSRPQIFALPNGSAVLLFYNNTSDSYDGGNVIWGSAGRPVGSEIRWSQPQPLLVSKSPEKKYSLPFFFSKNGSYWLFTRNGKRGALRKVGANAAKFLDSDPERTLATRGMLLNLKNIERGGRTVPMPRIPDVKKRGLTVEFTANFENAEAGVPIFDNTDAQGKGLKVETAPGRAFSVYLNDGVSQFGWTTDAGAYVPGKDAHIAIVIDGRSKLAMSVYDGQVCDGDSARPFGWETFYPEISSVNASGSAVVARGFGVDMKRFRIYSRPLSVSEIISNKNSGR